MRENKVLAVIVIVSREEKRELLYEHKYLNLWALTVVANITSNKQQLPCLNNDSFSFPFQEINTTTPGTIQNTNIFTLQ